MFGTVDRLQELLARLLGEVQALIRAELQLAQAEMAEKAKSAGRAIAYAAVAGTFLFFSVFGFLIAAIAGLHDALLPVWASALVVSGCFVLLAALVGWIAFRRAKRASPPYPDAAIENVRTMPDDLREAAR